MMSDDLRRYFAELSRKYLWWEAVGEEAHAEDRVIAQVMNLGTFDDIMRLERTLGKDRLIEVMRGSEPGWLNDRSWEFWRGRLSRATGVTIPDRPPRRRFDAIAP